MEDLALKYYQNMSPICLLQPQLLGGKRETQITFKFVTKGERS